MKRLNQLLTVFFLSFLIGSCKKDEVKLTPLASLNIINAVVGGMAIKLNTLPTTIAYNANSQFTLLAGNSSIYVYPVGDSSHPYYSNTIQTANGSYYSLFLSGQAPTIDTILIKDVVPYRADSTFGLRFINLSPNSPAVSVNLTGGANGSEVASLPYKSITEFKTYPGLAANATTSFEIRNAATGTVLVTYTFNSTNPIPRFHN